MITLVLTVTILSTQAFVRVQAQSYQQIIKVTGSGNQTTDNFNVPTSDWRIIWSYVPNPSYPALAIFSVFAYPKGESSAYATNVVQFGDSNTSGVVYVHQGQNDYYLKIIVTSVKSYIITVESQQESISSPTIPEYPLTALLVGLISVSVLAFEIMKNTKKLRRYNKGTNI